MGGVGGHRHQRDVARIDIGQGKVDDPFFGTDQGHHFMLGVDINAVLPLAPAADRVLELRRPFKRGITVVLRVAERVDQRLVDLGRRRDIGIAHAEVDQVGSFGDLFGLDLVQLGKNIDR